MRRILALIILCIFGGCSVAPVNTTNTARSIGKDKNFFSLSLPIPGIQYQRGLSDNWDAGLGIERQLEAVINIYTKYAFINHTDKGASLSTLAGAGFGTGIGKSKSQYIGGITSYRYSWFEPFFAYRKNFVHWSNNVTPSELDKLLNFIPRKSNFNYDQFDVGVNFAGERITFALGAKVLVFKDASNVLPFVDLGFIF